MSPTNFHLKYKYWHCSSLFLKSAFEAGYNQTECFSASNKQHFASILFVERSIHDRRTKQRSPCILASKHWDYLQSRYYPVAILKARYTDGCIVPRKRLLPGLDTNLF